MSNQASYTAASIRVMGDIEAIRTRPGMYIGDPSEGPQALLMTTLENCLAGGLSGEAARLHFTFHRDGSYEIILWGRSFLIEKDHDGRYVAEVLFTSLFGPGYNPKIFPRGLGFIVTNALSEWLELTSHHECVKYRQRFERGKPQPPTISEIAPEASTTHLIFRPDPSIVAPATAESDQAVYKMLERISYFFPGLEVIVENKLTPKTSRFLSPNGFVDWLQKLTQDKRTIFSSPLCLYDTIDGVSVEIFVQWTRESTETIYSFSNYQETRDHGMHVAGFRSSLTRVLSAFSTKCGLQPECIKRGLVAVIAVQLDRPIYSGATGEKLVSIEAKSATQTLVIRQLPALLQKHASERQRLLRHLRSTYQYKRPKTRTCEERNEETREEEEKLAQSPTITNEQLLILLRSKNKSVLDLLAQNPGVPLETLFLLSQKRPQLFLQNPVLPLLLLSEPSLPKRFPKQVVAALLANQRVEPALWELLCEHEDREVVRMIAGDERLPLSLVEQLSNTKDERIAVALLKRNKLHNQILKKLWENLSASERATFIKSSAFPVYLMELCSRDPNHELRRLVASDPSLPSDIFERLAADREVSVREAIARNHSTLSHLLEALACDPSLWVRRSAAQNPSTPRGVLSLLRRAGASESLLGAQTLTKPDPSLTVEELKALYQSGPFARWLVACHPNTPKDLLEKLTQEEVPSIREEAKRRLTSWA